MSPTYEIKHQGMNEAMNSSSQPQSGGRHLLTHYISYTMCARTRSKAPDYFRDLKKSIKKKKNQLASVQIKRGVYVIKKAHVYIFHSVSPMHLVELIWTPTGGPLLCCVSAHQTEKTIDLRSKVNIKFKHMKSSILSWSYFCSTQPCKVKSWLSKYLQRKYQMQFYISITFINLK